jgi:hypothetical protein
LVFPVSTFFEDGGTLVSGNYGGAESWCERHFGLIDVDLANQRPQVEGIELERRELRSTARGSRHFRESSVREVLATCHSEKRAKTRANASHGTAA